MLPDSYERWNAALVERYFPPSAAGRPVYLAVDEDELDLLATDLGESRAGASALSKAVRDVVRAPHTTLRVFSHVSRNWRDWSSPAFVDT
jgi:hypothetical protein